MSTISTCPRCSRLVAIPQGLDSTALVRCPMCDCEYPLNEAIKLIPPELIPVAASEEAILIDISQPISEADQQEADVIPLESAAIKSIPIHAPIKSPSADSTSKPSSGLVAEPFYFADIKQASDLAAPPMQPKRP